MPYIWHFFDSNWVLCTMIAYYPQRPTRWMFAQKTYHSLHSITSALTFLYHTFFFGQSRSKIWVIFSKTIWPISRYKSPFRPKNQLRQFLSKIDRTKKWPPISEPWFRKSKKKIFFFFWPPPPPPLCLYLVIRYVKNFDRVVHSRFLSDSRIN